MAASSSHLPRHNRGSLHPLWRGLSGGLSPPSYDDGPGNREAVERRLQAGIDACGHSICRCEDDVTDAWLSEVAAAGALASCRHLESPDERSRKMDPITGTIDKLEEALGHSPHPAIVALPVGAWSVSNICDGLYLLSGNDAYDNTAQVEHGHWPDRRGGRGGDRVARLRLHPAGPAAQPRRGHDSRPGQCARRHLDHDQLRLAIA